MSPAADYMADEEVQYQVNFRSQHAEFVTHKRPSLKTRSGSRPKSFNGIHRRRAKRIRW
jgi:hypothetical protein